MSFVESCKRMIRAEEGWRDRPYDDATGRPVRAPIGKITIGYGFNLAARGLPAAVGDYWLEHLIKETVSEAEQFDVYHALSDVRKMALIDMIFNMGVTSVRGFKLFLGALARNDWVSAAKEIENSAYYMELPSRANHKITMILTNENPYL
jgi:lysozyme